MGNNIHQLWGFPLKGCATGKNIGCATPPRKLLCHPWGAGSYWAELLAGTGGEQGVQPAAGMFASVGRDAPHWPTGECVPCPHQPRGESRGCPKGQDLVGFKAAISPHWKAGSMSVVMAPENRSIEVPACANHMCLLAALQHSGIWAYSWQATS